MAETSITEAGKFDYAGVDAETKALCIGKTEEIRGYLTRSTESMVEAGRRLAEVKSALKHGQFGAWLNAEFKLSERTAENLINVFGKSEIISDLGKNLGNFTPTALNLLSAPSTPKKALVAAVKRASKGEHITVKTAKELKAAYGMAAGSPPTPEQVVTLVEPEKAVPEGAARRVEDVPYKKGEQVIFVPGGFLCSVVMIYGDGTMKLAPRVGNAYTRRWEWASLRVPLEEVALAHALTAVRNVVPTTRVVEMSLRERCKGLIDDAPEGILPDVLHLLEGSVTVAVWDKRA